MGANCCAASSASTRVRAMFTCHAHWITPSIVCLMCLNLTWLLRPDKPVN